MGFFMSPLRLYIKYMIRGTKQLFTVALALPLPPTPQFIYSFHSTGFLPYLLIEKRLGQWAPFCARSELTN